MLNSVVQDGAGVPVTKTELDVDDLHEQEEDEALFARAEATNRFCSSPGVSSVGIEISSYAPPEITPYRDDVRESELSVSREARSSKKTGYTAGTVSSSNLVTEVEFLCGLHTRVGGSVISSIEC